MNRRTQFCKGSPLGWARTAWMVWLVASLYLMAGIAQAAAPPLGTVIGNQATVTFTDATGTSRTVASNLVETVVAQKAGLTLTADQTKQVAAGNTVYFPHVITNTGNGPDTFNLSAVDANTGAINFNSLVVYPDANLDGLPDSTTPIAVTPALQAGATYGIVIAAQIPTTAANADAETITVTATSVFTPAQTVVNTDTVQVTTGAVVTATKALSVISGPSPNTNSGNHIEVTLSYINTSTSAATSVVLADALPSGMLYVAASGTWSVGGGVALTDAVAGDPVGIAYDYTGTTVTATIASVPAGASGWVKFEIDIANAAGTTAPGLGLPDGTATTTNTATYTYTGGPASQSTNPASYTVSGASAGYGVIIGNTTTITQDAVPGTPSETLTIAAATQGATVSFTDQVQNTGGASDSFNINVVSNTFPSGTSFTLYNALGTPLLDSNGDGIPDTGAVAPGATINIVVKATLPSGISGGGPYEVIVQANSVHATPIAATMVVTDTTKDVLTTITASSVDLYNSDTTGTGVGSEAAAQKTVTGAAGSTVTFPLIVKNTSTIADNYNLAASPSTTFPATMPAGWTVWFTDDLTGATVTNTGNIAGSDGTRAFTAHVTIPANAVGGTTELYFQAQSPVTGATDPLHDAVTVTIVTDLSLTPNNAAQSKAGGIVVYSHTLKNSGNLNVPAGTPVILDDSLVAAGWASMVYEDADNNGVIDATDVQFTATTAILAPGAQVNLLVKVFVPAGATVGAVNTTTIAFAPTATYSDANAANNSAQDTTTVVTGDLKVEKFQALDTACTNGTGWTYQTAKITSAAAQPGACIAYKVVTTNIGVAAATAVSVTDATPAYTTFNGGTAGSSWAFGVTPGVGSTGAITMDGNGTSQTLQPGNSATLYFTVKINL